MLSQLPIPTGDDVSLSLVSQFQFNFDKLQYKKKKKYSNFKLFSPL